MDVNPPFGRLLTAMVTPFEATEEVSLRTAKRLARHLVETGSDGIVVTGTTGESPTLDDHEKIALYEAVVDEVGPDATVIAGTGTYDTAHSVRLSQAAADVGVGGIMAVTPYYSRPSQAGLEAHFTAIADATDLPLLLYNIPIRTGRLIEVETVCRLSLHPKIVAIKDATGDAAHTTAVIAGAHKDFAVYAGDDVNTLPVMSLGGVGVVSVAAHIVGRHLKAMIEAFRDGKVDDAAGINRRLAEVFRLLFVEPNPTPVKAALRLVGIDAGDPRLPLLPAQPSTIDAFRDQLAELN